VVADFSQRDLAPHVERWNAAKEAPLEAIKLMGDLGLFGLGGPEEYGGAGDFTSLCIAIEEIGKVDQSLGITLEAAVGLGINPIAHFGTAEQKQRWLPELLAGRALAAFGLTEAESGSDAGATRTRAERRDGQWVINGSKQFITNSGTDITSLCTVTARTGTRANGKPEISTLVVPAGTPGFVVEPAYAKLGWHASDTHPLTFTDVVVPEDHLLGVEARVTASSSPSWTTAGWPSPRWPWAASGPAWSSRSRTPVNAPRFGGPIGRKQGVAFKIADLDVMAAAAHQLSTRPRPCATTARAAGLQSGSRDREALRHRIGRHRDPDRHPGLRRLRVHGGVSDRPLLPRRQGARDRRGTSEVQRLLIARRLGLPVE
jgi:butyryl-CoA dehydrogenase